MVGIRARATDLIINSNNMKKLLVLPVILSFALVGCGSDPRAKDPNCMAFKNFKGQIDYACSTPSTASQQDYRSPSQMQDEAAMRRIAKNLSGEQTHDWDGAEAQENRRQAFAECKENPGALFCK